MYTLTIQHFPSNTIEYRSYTNIARAIQYMHERCDELGYNVEPDNEGNFLAGGIGNDYRFELNSNF
jgi:hypothetical protein